MFCAAFEKFCRQLSCMNCVVASSGQPISRRPWSNWSGIRSSNHFLVLTGSRDLALSSIFLKICAVFSDANVIALVQIVFDQ